MTLIEAMKQSGLCRSVVLAACKRSEFEAYKPRGNRGGWDIDPISFRGWIIRRKLKSGNAIARAAARRELEAAR